jgi:hypothetical protein
MQSRWLLGILVIVAIMPTLTFAAHSTIKTDVWNPTILAGPLTVCGAPVTLSNSGSKANSNGCQDLCDFVAQIIQVLYFIIAVGIWIIIPILFAWGGVKIMIARGDPGKASEGRKTLTGAVVGVIIMICAWLIVSIFVHFFNLSSYIPYFGNGGSSCTITK